MPEIFLDARETAARLGLSLHTVRAWVRARRLPFYQVGRRTLFAETDVTEFLKHARVEAERPHSK